MNTLFIALQAQQPATGIDVTTILMFVGIIVIFYFFMIRPQQKKQKEIKRQREAMKKGDTVITAGGIYGKIREVRDDSLIIEVDKDVKIRVDKNSVYPSAADANEAQQQDKK